jgi:hypothetical protein
MDINKIQLALKL